MFYELSYLNNTLILMTSILNNCKKFYVENKK